MSMFNLLSEMFQYLTEGVTEVFSPNHDDYPNIGVQPFDGEPFAQWIDLTNLKR